jgi:putative PIN family toxin of toxin-antitoxin system
MRAVADSNVVVSGLLWRGPSRDLLDRAHRGDLELFTSPALLLELQDVLHRRKFSRRFKLARVKPQQLIVGYANLATLVAPTSIDPVVAADPDDDEVLACAVAATVGWIVSGDRHLLDLQEYQGIRILTPRQALTLLRETE